jgi:hypothetical protein
MMNTTNPSTTISLSVVDDDSRRLAIIYGTLGTTLALASLAFAALTWARSRRHQCAGSSKTRATTDRALEGNELGPDTREAYELEGSAAADCVAVISRYFVFCFKSQSTNAYFLIAPTKT